MGGTSGALYDIFFHAVAAQLKQHPISPTDGAHPTTCAGGGEGLGRRSSKGT
jgi:hypothetical protein